MGVVRTLLDGTGKRYVVSGDRVTVYSPDGPPVSMGRETALKHSRLPGHVQDEIRRGLKPKTRRPMGR